MVWHYHKIIQNDIIKAMLEIQPLLTNYVLQFGIQGE